MKKIILLFTVLFVGITTLAAQEFVVEPQIGTDTNCYKVEKNNDGFKIILDEEQVRFNKGYVFKCIGIIKDKSYLVFEEDGQYYAANANDLQLTENNPEEMKELLKEKKTETTGGKFSTYKIVTTSILWMIMFFVMLVAAAVSFLYVKKGYRKLRQPFLKIVPIAIITFSVLEIYGYYRFEDSMFWWCDYDFLGFFGSLLSLIPFGAMVAAQVYSIKVYEKGLFGMDETADPNNPKKISLKPAAWGLALTFPATIAVAIALSLCGIKGVILDIVAVGTFLVTLCWGVIKSYRRNIETFGAATGLWITLFSIAYIIGCIISAIALITLIFKIIFQILLVIGAILILMFLAPRRRIYRNGRVYEEI